MTFKVILFIIIALLIYSALVFYIGWNIRVLMKSFGLKRGKVAFWIIYAFIAYSIMLTRFISLDFLKIISDYWLFAFSYGLILCIVCNILSLILRRRYTRIIGSSAIVILLISAGVGTYYAYTPIVHHQTIERPEKANGQQLKVVVASDTHLGLLSNKKHLSRFVELANKEKPDVVILAGDLVDDSPKWFNEQQMEDELKKLQATYGVYAVLGNHEYIGDELPAVKQAMKNANVTLLQDQTVTIAGDIALTGRDDATNKKRASLKTLQKDVKSGQPWIVIDHQPSKTMNDPGVSFMMSGHTHAGQIWPGKWMTEFIYELNYGHEKRNGTDYLVTSGYGFWGPPMRIGTQAELWSVTLQFK